MANGRTGNKRGLAATQSNCENNTGLSGATLFIGEEGFTAKRYEIFEFVPQRPNIRFLDWTVPLQSGTATAGITLGILAISLRPTSILHDSDLEA
jgi:hypothetical protein